MISIVQERLVSSSNGSGTVHDLPFSGSVTPGSTLLCLLFSGEDVNGATVNGMAGPPAATLDYSETIVVNTARVFRLTDADGSATGFRVTTDTSHFDLTGWILELAGVADTSPFTDSGTFPFDNGPTEIDATADVDAAGDAAFAFFADVEIANITDTRDGFTQSGESAGTALLQSNLDTDAGTVTAGCTLSSNAFFSAGYVVTYKAGASFQAAWARNSNQVIQ